MIFSIFKGTVILVLAAFPASASGTVQSVRDARSERPPAPADSAYHVEAGSSTLKEIAGEKVLELQDGVKIIHGDVTITSRRGLQYSERRLTYLLGDVKIDQDGLHMEGEVGEYRRFRDQAILKGNVRIVDRRWEISCDEALFYRSTDRAVFKGNVEVADSATTLTADSVYYDRRFQTAEAFGDVSITNTAEGITVKGKHGFYYRDRGLGVVDEHPTLVVDPNSAEPAVVRSDTMRFHPDERRAVAKGRVRIIKGNTVTQCDSAVVFDNDKRAELYGNPLAKKERVSMGGNQMVLGYNDEEVDRIWINGDANIKEAQADSLVIGRDNWIKGDSVLIFLESNRVDSIRVTGRSSSEYYPQGKNPVESNFAQGNEMFFEFQNDSLAYLEIIGNAEGAYRHLKLKETETADTLRSMADTTLIYVPFDKNADKVSYAADKIEYYAQKRDIVLRKNARVVYHGRTLLGDMITYNSTLQLLDAVGSPVLVEGQDKLHGDRMDYDMESGVGLVENGSTKFMQGYYQGKQIAKVGDSVLKVWHSTYTTCDLAVPHYHFASNYMKVYLDDKVVSGPIGLFIGDTPIAFLPFFAQNIRRGRRSGILRPDFEFGITKTTGRFIRNLGYYWATNDYTDFTFVGDFNEDSSIRFFIGNRYNLRYRFSGGLNLSLFRDLRTYRNEWTLSSSHFHNLGEKSSLTSDLRFVSSDRAPRAVSRIDEVADVIDRRIESRVSYRKSWESVGFSASGRRVQNLDVTDPSASKVSTTLPSISLSIPSRSLYFGKEPPRGKQTLWQRMLGGIRYSPGLSMDRSTEERLNDFTETIRANSSLSFSSPTKIGFVNISPSLTASNVYTRKVTEIDEHLSINTGTVPPDTTLVPASRTVDRDNIFDWSTGARASTNLYGTFYPEIGVLRGIRHTLSPSVAYTFRPELGNRASSQSVSVSLTNAVDLKVRDGDEEKKLSGVLLWSLGSNYNPQAPSKKGWSTISSRINVRVLGSDVSVSQTIDPYLLDILTTQVNTGIQFSGTHMIGASDIAADLELNRAASDTAFTGAADETEPPAPGGPAEGKRGLPWSVGASFSYSKSQFGDPRSTLNLNGTVNLTRSWRIGYTTNYDVQNRELLGQNYTIHRDLHCWEMSFTRQQLGDEWEFYFKISLKVHPEVYAESGRRGLGGVGGFSVPFQY